MSSLMQIAPRPETKELVTNEILRYVGLNPQAFSGAQNPSTIYQSMVLGGPSVYPYYREAREKDTAIISSAETRRIMAMSREASVISADPNADTGPAKEYADGLNGFLDSVPGFRRARRELLGCVGFGFSVQEILWKISGGFGTALVSGASADGELHAASLVNKFEIGIERIVGRPQEFFRFGKLFDPQTGPLLLATTPGGEGSPVPLNKFIVATSDEENGDRRGTPLLRRLYWPSWFKRNVLRLHLQFLEKGPGTVGVTYPAGASAAEKTQALNSAAAIATELAVAVPETFKIIPELLQTTRTRQGADFQAMFDYMDAEMTRIYLGQTLTTRGAEQGRGTMSLGSIHQDVMFEFVRNDLADQEDVINEQLCAPWLVWTYGPQALDRAVRPYWRTKKDPPKDTAAALDELSKAHAMGVRIAERTVYEQGQIEEPEDSDNLLPAITQPMDIFGKPGAGGDASAGAVQDGTAE